MIPRLLARQLNSMVITVETQYANGMDFRSGKIAEDDM
jgi:hypothetical protein